MVRIITPLSISAKQEGVSPGAGALLRVGPLPHAKSHACEAIVFPDVEAGVVPIFPDDEELFAPSYDN